MVERNSVTQSFREVGRGNRALRDSIFILGGGGSVGWQVTSGHTPLGIVKHDHSVRNPLAFNQKCLLDLCRDRGGVERRSVYEFQ